MSENKNENIITEYTIPIQFFPSIDGTLPSDVAVVQRPDSYLTSELDLTSSPILITYLSNGAENKAIGTSTDNGTEHLSPSKQPMLNSRKLRQKGINRRLENKKLRMAGKPYIGYGRTNTGKTVDVERSSRKIGPRCNCADVRLKTKCETTNRPTKLKPWARRCNEFTEESRLNIFNKFWDMDWNNRKIYVNSLVKRSSTRQPKRAKDGVTKIISRRTFTMEYNLPTIDNICKRVCKKMFLNTLGMKEFSILKWVTGSQYGLCSPTKSIAKRASFKRKEADFLHLYNWFNALQKFTTSVGKKTLTKLYVDEKFPTKTHFYRAYKQDCLDVGRTPLSRNTFVVKMKCHNLHILNSLGDTDRPIQLFPVSHTEVLSAVKGDVESDLLSSAQKRINKRVEAQNLRMKGKPYSGYTKTEDGKKIINERGGRILGPRCVCGGGFVRRCKDIPDECREEIFEKFWELDWPQRKVYVNSLVKRVPTKRKSKAESRRKGTLVYSLPLFDNSKIKVCKKMFLHTLGMKEFAISSWVSQSECGVPSPQVRKKPSINKKKSNDFVILTNWLHMQVKLKKRTYDTTNKTTFVLPEYATKAQVYEAYQRYCEESNVRHLSKQSVYVTMDKLNLILPPPDKGPKVKRKIIKKSLGITDTLENIQEVQEVQEAEGKEYETVNEIRVDVGEVKYCPSTNVETVMYYPTYNPSGYY